MPSSQKINLSYSLSGTPILITATATGANGTNIHSATTATGNVQQDALYVYAQNLTTATASVTFQQGTSATANWNKVILPAQGSGSVPIYLGDLLLNDSAVLMAFASATDSVTVHGYANRITD